MQHKPFDEQCARIDFRDKIETQEKESERRNGFVKVEDIKVETGNLDRYGDESRFELIKDVEAYDDIISSEGKKTRGIIGHMVDYKCKQRGHGVSVLVPLVVYNERKGKKVKKEE